MLLEDYHLVFIIISFIMLFISIELIFVDGKKGSILAGGILCGINWLICLINYMSFFGVGLTGVDSDGAAIVTIYSGMYNYFIVFYLIQWINVIFVYLCWYKWSQHGLDVESKGKSLDVF